MIAPTFAALAISNIKPAAFGIEQLATILAGTKGLIAQIYTLNNPDTPIDLQNTAAKDFSFRTKKGRLFMDFQDQKHRVSHLVYKNGLVTEISGEKIYAYQGAIPRPSMREVEQKAPERSLPAETPPAANTIEAAPQTEALTEIANKEFVSTKSPEDLALFKKIVVDHDANSLALYLQKAGSKLTRFARRVYKNEDLLEDVIQELSIRLLTMQAEDLEGTGNAFCKDYRYFDTWVHSVARNMAYNMSLREDRHHHEYYDTASDYPDDVVGFGQNFAPEADMPGVSFSEGFEDPLKFLIRRENAVEYQRTLSKIMDLAKSSPNNPCIGMVLDSSIKTSGEVEEYGSGKDYNSLAEEQDIPVGTVRSRISNGRRQLVKNGLKPEFI
ncbi:MAG: hypothetical protein PHX61_00015 [Alphaproteobacteria bacterium]|nr:hypothetical protein [Alphaproteobacteria bacterium]